MLGDWRMWASDSGGTWYVMCHPETGHVVAGSFSQTTSHAWAWHRPGYILFRLNSEDARRIAASPHLGLNDPMLLIDARMEARCTTTV